MAVFSSFGNDVFYTLRKSIPNIRSNYRETSSDIAQDLLNSELLNSFSFERAQVSLFYAWILGQLNSVNQLSLLNDRLRAIDIGSRDFPYAPALCHFLGQQSQTFELIGLEYDPYVFYANLYRRGQAGQYAANLCQKFYTQSSIQYCAGNWLTANLGRFDIGFLFFPFLFPDLHRRFRLPISAYNPKLFYQKAIETCRYLIFFHQGDEEFEESIQLLDQLPGKILETAKFRDNPWWKRNHSVNAIVFCTD